MELDAEATAETAYIKYVENVAPDRVASVKRIYRTPEEISTMIARYGLSIEELPKPVLKIIRDKGNFLVDYRFFEAQEGRFGHQIEELNIHPLIKDYLRSIGIKKLFKFQERAINTILSGKDTIIVAPTGNGKTEAFVIPILQKILEESPIFGSLRPHTGEVIALFIYPTKALARDQLTKFKRIERVTGVRFAVFDGDTPEHERQKIFDDPPDILITNPDIIHYHLMRRGRLRSLFRTVRYVVLDEIHEYVGAFGANVYFILRRLERFTGRLQIIGASATISNPDEFGRLLFGREVTVVSCDDGRRGKMHFLMIYPLEKSTTVMIAEAVKDLVDSKYKALVFANSHRMAEIINLVLRRLKVKSEVHRAGLPEAIRHKIEDEFKRGKLPAIVATPTLELGIDIGDVNSVVSMIINFTRLTQRIGRAGRKGQESIAILALRNDDPISTYYKEHPADYFSGIAPAFIEPHNEVVAYYQILATAMDSPIRKDEFKEFKRIITQLLEQNLLRETSRSYMPNYKEAKSVLYRYNIRGIGDSVKIYEGNRVIGFRSMPMAARELHPGAIYIHGGKFYKSIDFKFERHSGKVLLERLPPDYKYKTDALRFTHPEILEVREKKDVFGIEVLYCKLRITEVVVGYILSEVYTNKKIETKMLDTPISYTFDTMGFVFTAPTPEKSVENYEFHPDLPEGLENRVDLIGGAFHALEHVLIEGSEMLTGGGSSEIGGISMGDSGIIFIYDGIPGGSGLSKLLYNKLSEGFIRSLEILKGCQCKRIDGCPACTYSYQCGNNNKPLFKIGAIESLEKILSKEFKLFVDTEKYKIYKPFV